MTETAVRSPLRIWGRRLLLFVLLPILALILLAAITLYAMVGPGLFRLFDKPPVPFEQVTPPPAPDYAKAGAWLAWPGRNGLERSTPPGMKPVDEATAPVDVFFIHPTTFANNKVWNGAYDAPVSQSPLEPAVLLDQASTFNGCCRIYAPHYRQASVKGLENRKAADLAYSDVANAFRYYIAHENKGRPFIIASHSQGTGHAIFLLEKEILGTPLQKQMVAAYLIGGYVPEEFASIGLPVCDGPRATGCVISWNASKGWKASRMVIDNDKTYDWQGQTRRIGQTPAICVNPLTWRKDGGAEAKNPGSLKFPKAPWPDHGGTMGALYPDIAPAECGKKLLIVHVPWSAPTWFADGLSNLFGSYHINDYGIFYASIRQNAVDRTQQWMADHPRKN